jgi:hypothetical protein
MHHVGSSQNTRGGRIAAETDPASHYHPRDDSAPSFSLRRASDARYWVRFRTICVVLRKIFPGAVCDRLGWLTRWTPLRRYRPDEYPPHLRWYATPLAPIVERLECLPARIRARARGEVFGECRNKASSVTLRARIARTPTNHESTWQQSRLTEQSVPRNRDFRPANDWLYIFPD